jgi:uncharacterized alkaline shock family protein YloU
MAEDERPTQADDATPALEIRIADDVVASIASMAASDVPGVFSMAGGLVGDLTERLGRRNWQKGVKVDVQQGVATIDLYVVVLYGSRIPEIAQKVQERVRAAVESMTGLKVKAVDVHVQGVGSPDDHPIIETGGSS